MLSVSVEDMKQAKNEADMQAKTMQLNVVRLCFQAYLQDHQGQITQVLPSQISNPIYDSSKCYNVGDDFLSIYPFWVCHWKGDRWDRLKEEYCSRP